MADLMKTLRIQQTMKNQQSELQNKIDESEAMKKAIASE